MVGEGESVARQLLLLRSDSYPDIVEVDKVGYVDNTELEFKVWGDRELFQMWQVKSTWAVESERRSRPKRVL